MSAELPRGLRVFERGWLSSNNILIQGREGTALVDSGYCIHAAQTLALVQAGLGERPLDQLVNTHLHSDHCGGNAALQQAYGQLHTRIPQGQAEQVRAWLPYEAEVLELSQQCPRFAFDDVLRPGTELQLGDQAWQVHASPGHDVHSLVLFEPQSRTLISADALWQSGFGVVFSEVSGQGGFDEVGRTLDLIEGLAPRVVIPGHGPVFTDVAAALALARRRLDGFVRDPLKHAVHAGKVLVKFKLLEVRSCELAEMARWIGQASFFRVLRQRFFPDEALLPWLQRMALDLQRSGALRLEGSRLIDQPG